ncbi:teichoic acids export ABC transporter ATP-binding subunit TagH [Neobacillus pocheonensis]|uniref:Teichoic acids export ABC transporter ATP-binding subunit TagH n=1 Tax=Neobacillus pocheonensis TaxID=363869 RepID=A0ABT0WIX7_9BACI|nr:teichoic acids export ABC transporter ATP-binding subunit TagH [Neobacillus pocheonensis]
MDTSVVFKNVTKKYKMYNKTSEKLLDLALPSGYGKDFYALQNISFVAEKGDIIGIIGVNGAGKSTLSNLISGVIPPSKGSIKIDGDAALISIGAGLNNQLTGRENIELKCLMLGFTKQEIQDLMPDIIEFAEIGDFIDQPVKSYSSGMKSRLGFAISVNIDPDVLVIDEALSVGDKIFAQKCLDKMNSFKEKGKTIFFISHSSGQVKEFCQKALWLEAGEVKAYGTVEEIIPQYEQFINVFNKMSKAEKKQFNQMIMDKRSGKLKADTAENDLSVLGRGHSTRKKPKCKMKRLVSSFLILLAIVIIPASIIFIKDQVTSHLLVNREQQAEKFVNSTMESATVDQADKQQVTVAAKTANETPKDIRYVQVASGYVRDTPNLSTSQRINTVNFGEQIIVEQVEKDPAENFNWLKFTLNNGQTGWISDKIAMKLASNNDENSFVSKFSNFAQVPQLPEILTYFGKTEQELGTAAKSNNTAMTYNQNGQLKEVSLTIKGVTPSRMVAQLGEPVLRQGVKMYLYHGEAHDFILTSINGVTFNKVTVKPL